MSNKEGTASIQSVDRALAILEFLFKEKKAASVLEISDAVGIKRTTAYGLLNTLINNEYVIRTDSGRYTVSAKTYSLSYNYPSRLPIFHYVHKYMVELSEKYQETVNLGTLSLKNNILLVKAQVPNHNKNASCGDFFPLHSSGLGKTVLAFLPEEKQNELIENLDMVQYTEKTITDKDLLRKELEAIKERGYALDDGEYLEGTLCISFPLFDNKDAIAAAISVSGFMENIRPRMEQIITDGLRCSKQCSAEMGWTRYNRLGIA